MLIKGKQIKDNSVKQEKINITTDTINTTTSVTNAEYVNNNSLNRVQSLTYATLNLNMSANNATIGQLACNSYVIEFPISNIIVKVNNVSVSVGIDKDCYFSPDGIIIRGNNDVQKGDYLYWNSNRFNLDSTDEIDFVFITAKETVILNENTNVVIEPYYTSLNVRYIGTESTTMNVVIEDQTFVAGNVGGNFVWDIGGSNEHTFLTVGESHQQTVNSNIYTIWFDGFGSLLFSIKKQIGQSFAPRLIISLLSSDNLISTNVDNIVVDNGILYIKTSILSGTYTDTIYKYNNDDNWLKIETPKGYNNQYSYSDFIVKNNKIFIGAFYRDNESDSNYIKIASSDNQINYVSNYTNSIGYIYSFNIFNNNIYVLTRMDYTDYGYDFRLMKSIDNGETWNIINNNIAHGNHYTLYILNDNIFWLYGTRQYYINSTFSLKELLYKTTDGGLTFNLLYETDVTNSIDFNFIDTNNGWCINRNENKIKKTIDGGLTWIDNDINISLTDNITYRNLSVFNNNLYVAIDTYDLITGNSTGAYILISTDSGITWNVKNITTNIFYIESYDGLTVVSDNIFYISGKYDAYYMPVILKTIDGGNTWIEILNKYDNRFKFTEFYSSFFINDNIGFLIGDKSTLLKTINGGTTWLQNSLPVLEPNNKDLTNIYFVNNNVGFIFGYDNSSTDIIMLKTNDQGENWVSIQFENVYGYLDKMFFINDNIGWVVGYDTDNNSILYKTTDGGNTWTNMNFIVANGFFDNIKFKTENIGYVSGYSDSNALLYKTIDGGVSWEQIITLNYIDMGFFGLDITQNALYIIGGGNNDSIYSIQKSVDDGLTWSSYTINTQLNNYASNIKFSDNNNGLFIYNYTNDIGKNVSVIYSTTDGGTTWTVLNDTLLTGNYNDITNNRVLGYRENKTVVLFKL